MKEFAPQLQIVGFLVSAFSTKTRAISPAEPKCSTANSPRSCSCAGQMPGTPNREPFCLVQHPHNAQQRGNSSNNNQNGEYRYLSPVEVIVLCQSCLAVV